MNTAFNSFGSVETAKGANQVTKTVHQQRPPASYTQSALMPQGLGNMHTNTNVAHSHQSQQHHYSLNASGQYMNQNLGQIPASNHPVANPVATAAGQGYNSQKNISNFQNSFTPPISQPLPASVPQQSNSSGVGAEKPQSNGTTDIKQSPQKNENLTAPSHLEHDKEKVQLSEKPSPVQPTPVPMLPQVQEKAREKTAPTSSEMISEPTDSKASCTTTPTSPAKKPPTSSLTSQPPSNETSNPPASVLAVAAPTKPAEDLKAIPLSEVIEAKEEKASEVVNTKQTEVEKNSESEDIEEEKDPLDANEEEEPENGNISPDPLNLDDDKSSSSQEQAKQESPSKKAIPAPKTPARKTKAQQSKSEEALKTPKTPALKSPSTSKVKRQRIRTQHYQSPLPEVELISKISSSTSRNNEDKLIVFYKNEFLAVRNAEGSFYLCQAIQNIYKSSSKIKIRWLSQDKNDKTGEIYTPDFYDLTDFDCILTNLSLSKVDKGKFRLPPSEKDRTQSILNRSLAVEKGEVTSPSLTEEHPDGLDLSLYRDTDQLKKRRARKRKLQRGRSTSNTKKVPTKKEPEVAKVRKVSAPAKSTTRRTAEPVPKKATSAPSVKSAPSTSSKSTGRGKRKVEPKTSAVVDQKKAKVLAKIGKKSAVPAAKTTQNSAKNAKSAKSKPSASTSKAAPAKTNPKAAAASKAPPRSTRRSTRK